MERRPNFFEYWRLYKAAVEKHVCQKCIDLGPDNVCHSKDPMGCAVFRYLPQLIDIALDLGENRLEFYVAEVRRRLCAVCHNSGQGGHKCELRDAVDCGLDRYLPLVMEAIEEVHKSLREEKTS